MAIRYSEYDRGVRRGYQTDEDWGYKSRRQDYQGRDRDDRGLVDRAADEVKSWFGDEDAERRRLIDDRRRSVERRFQSRRQSLDLLRARDVMTRDVVTLHPSDSIERAARLMRECDCGAIPVVDDDGRLLGMITDRDITIRLVARGIDIRNALVDDAMTDDSLACHLDDPLEDCMRVMSRHKIRRLPLVDDRGRVVGIISQADLAEYAGTNRVQGDRRAVADLLYEVSEPSYRSRR
jgi:CBS domain-containing protein